MMALMGSRGTTGEQGTGSAGEAAWGMFAMGRSALEHHPRGWGGWGKPHVCPAPCEDLAWRGCWLGEGQRLGTARGRG